MAKRGKIGGYCFRGENKLTGSKLKKSTRILAYGVTILLSLVTKIN